MARIMAFDYGSKRLGIAVTDPLGLIATGLCAIHPKDIGSFLVEYFKTEKVHTFLLGDPKQLDGSPSQSSAAAHAFAKGLQKAYPAIPVLRVDERFTSKMAVQIVMQSGLKKSERRQKERIDIIAATIILQDYLATLS